MATKLYADLSTRPVIDCSLESISPVFGILKSTMHSSFKSVSIILLEYLLSTIKLCY